MNKKLLRKKLALMLANLKKKRPYYCEVEYLESTGTQYILSGFTPTLNTDFEITLSSTNTGLNRWVMGCPTWVGVHYKGATNEVGITNSSTAAFQQYTPYNHDNSRLTMKLSGDTVYANGVSLGTISRRAGTLDFALFGYKDTNLGVTLNYIGNIYRCLIKDNGIPVRDFIPVLDWNYVPCMYDKVTGQLFYNEGTGDFSYGREIHYVDYLEGTGTQYIDTKEKVDSTTKIILDFQMTDITSGTNGIFGASTSQTLQFLTQTTNNKFVFQWTPNSIGNIGTKNTNRNTVILDIPNKVLSIGIDSLSISSYTFSYPTGNIFLMANGHTSVYGRMKVFGCKIFSGSSVLKDFYPAIDENGVGFLFDKVTHTCFLNAGTGVFNYPVRETEYTANAATQAYIDLGVKYKPSMTIEGKYTRNSYGTQGSVILVTTTTSAPLIYMPALSGTSTERFVWRRGGYTEQSYFINNIQYPFTAEIKIDAVNDVLTINNEIVKTGMIAGMNGYNSPYQSNSNMYMFSITGTYAGDGNVSYLKIIDGTTPLFDLIPAYKDGEAGFYNKVNGTFYKNASTNSSAKLTAGKIVEPHYE